jgi:hypothetical protein
MGDVIKLHGPIQPPRLRLLLNASRQFKTIRASRERLVQDLAVDVETVKRWELGQERIPVNVAAALASWFEVLEVFLLGLDPAGPAIMKRGEG